VHFNVLLFYIQITLSSRFNVLMPELINTSRPSARNTPLHETNALAHTTPLDTLDADKGIVVEAPDIDSSAIMVENRFDDDEEAEVVTPFAKRKRSSVNYNVDDSGHDKAVRGEPVAKRSRNGPKIRGVIIGVWRDSDQPNDEDKHVIFGFIDIHDRLRTRIYAMNRRGEELIGNIPTGAGGCWVTFPRIIFDSHLKSLNAAEVKEYVKIRSEYSESADPDERKDANMKAVLKAVSNAAQHEGGTPKPVVHRQSLGRQSNSNRQSLSRQSLGSTPGFKAVNAANIQTPKASPFAEGTKPSGVLLGYWSGSDEPRLEDKHAVYGVLGGSDCFRIKVARITRDGRHVDGNFPVGAGALWLHYDQVVLDEPLKGMSRLEVKEYVRIRQQDQPHESEKDRKANEARAIRQAKESVASDAMNNGVDQGRHSPEMEVRHSARSELRMAAKQQAEAEAAAERMRKEKVEARERQNEKTRKEVAMAEAVIQEAAQAELKNNLKKLNKVWVAQQAAIPGSSPAPPSDEVKFYNGIKYERKQSGPFQGKLVSSPQILSIDGEDYVEYRVLTKPSFF
jgi:hypothetical protein